MRRCSTKVQKIIPPAKIVVTAEGTDEARGEVADPRLKGNGKKGKKIDEALDLPLPPFEKDVPKPERPDPEAEVLIISEEIDFDVRTKAGAPTSPPVAELEHEQAVEGAEVVEETREVSYKDEF